MSDWTKRNFNELLDVSPEHVRIQWRFAREALQSQEVGVSRFTYEADARMPWGHRHREQEEVYVVAGGSGHSPRLEKKRGPSAGVAPGGIRSFEAGPDCLERLIGGRKPKGGDTERFEDFWT